MTSIVDEPLFISICLEGFLYGKLVCALIVPLPKKSNYSLVQDSIPEYSPYI